MILWVLTTMLTATPASPVNHVTVFREPHPVSEALAKMPQLRDFARPREYFIEDFVVVPGSSYFIGRLELQPRRWIVFDRTGTLNAAASHALQRCVEEASPTCPDNNFRMKALNTRRGTAVGCTTTRPCALRMDPRTKLLSAAPLEGEVSAQLDDFALRLSDPQMTQTLRARDEAIRAFQRSEHYRTLADVIVDAVAVSLPGTDFELVVATRSGPGPAESPYAVLVVDSKKQRIDARKSALVTDALFPIINGCSPFPTLVGTPRGAWIRAADRSVRGADTPICNAEVIVLPSGELAVLDQNQFENAELGYLHLSQLAEHQRALSLVREGKVDDAIALWSASVASGSSIFPKICSDLAGAYLARGQVDSALQVLMGCDEVDRTRADVHLKLGEAFRRSNDPVKATAELERALDLGLSASERALAETDLKKLRPLR